MKVHELITILQSFDQEALVCRCNFSNGWGEGWEPITDVDQESVGWGDQTNAATYEVFIQ